MDVNTDVIDDVIRPQSSSDEYVNKVVITYVSWKYVFTSTTRVASSQDEDHRNITYSLDDSEMSTGRPAFGRVILPDRLTDRLGSKILRCLIFCTHSFI